MDNKTILCVVFISVLIYAFGELVKYSRMKFQELEKERSRSLCDAVRYKNIESFFITPKVCQDLVDLAIFGGSIGKIPLKDLEGIIKLLNVTQTTKDGDKSKYYYWSEEWIMNRTVQDHVNTMISKAVEDYKIQANKKEVTNV